MRLRFTAIVFGLAVLCCVPTVEAQTVTTSAATNLSADPANGAVTTSTTTSDDLASAATTTLAADSAQGSSTPSGTANQQGGFIHDWLSMVSATQAEQPRWMTPLLTTTARLEQEFRYDVQTQPHNSGLVTNNFGVSKGLEIIPASRWEIILAVPPYIENNPDSVHDGFGDWQFLIKYRIISRNEEHGNFILTAFFQSTLPTGQYTQGNPDAVITPTIAYGKGFGDFDIQGTLGVTLPTGNTQQIGRTIPWNNTFQYHLFKKFWPELEVNYTRYYEGEHGGNTSVYLSPGIVLGRFKIHNRFAFAIGGGYEIAVTSFHPTNHIAVASVRFPF